MLLRVHSQPTGKVCASVHGMAGQERVWAFPDPADPARAIEQVQLSSPRSPSVSSPGPSTGCSGRWAWLNPARSQLRSATPLHRAAALLFPHRPMHNIKPSQYDRVRPLFQLLDHHLATAAILDGSAPAAIYVDDPAQPRAAFTWTGYRFFLAGSPQQATFNQHVRRLFVETIYPQARACGLEMFELKVASEDWEDAIRNTILPGQDPIKAQRQYFRLRALRHDWRTLLPADFHLAWITPELLARTDLAHLDDLREELCSERPSVEDFLARSFGVVAICDEDAALAGWCTSEYNSGDRCEVGIGTLEPYQRRGLATAMGSAFVEHALSRGVTQIGWHCWARNLPSIATALAIGYEQVCDYTSSIIVLRGQARS
jgi:RimJ/RimL family protein N-acetyltransferase